MKISVLSGILIICFSTLLHAQQTSTDSISITFNITVPESTPKDATIFWAGSLNNWDPGNRGTGFGMKEYAEAVAFQNGQWTITLTAPQGSEHSYKYTRGSIYSSEEQADYSFRPVRSVTFDKPKTVQDTVETWHDLPPESLSDQWPKIPLDTTQIYLDYNGKHLRANSTILYDKEIGHNLFDVNASNATVKSIPDNFYDAVYYYQKISATTNDLQLVSAAKTSPEEPWHIFVDTNGDKAISLSEKVFTIEEDESSNQWSGKVPVRNIIDGETITNLVPFVVSQATDLPPGYRSTARQGAPNLVYELPYKHRRGIIQEDTFNISTPYLSRFSANHQLTIDRNNDDTLEVGDGSNEVYASDFKRMRYDQTYFQFPSFTLGDQSWQVADIDPHGRWIRLRPALATETREAITKGTTAPQWKAETVKDDTLSSKKLQGKYILLDFWGSWCGPCIQQIPLLKKAYHRFKNQDFEMIGFAYQNQASLTKALQEYRLPWSQVLDDTGDYSSLFLVGGYPSYFLIGPDGTVLEMGSSLEGEQLIPTLEQYLE
ncbi:redoxin domain-containing protein [Fodinibius salsisoli]|uniref:Redoxin domain-containing protein n=1 Tax=Fodinibius salsisoli TaxID=2820877 RepID=A0ABT3PP15_9BACT|nr:redoxin domain-containing protein [Fodinibius salsisoli]MCW9707607.1 redoxin domain-containing protein [Fodinibius salsisoli]